MANDALNPKRWLKPTQERLDLMSALDRCKNAAGHYTFPHEITRNRNDLTLLRSRRIIGKRLLGVDLVVLNERLADLVDADTADCLQSTVATEQVQQALACGITLSYDATGLKLMAQVPAEHRREQMLSVRSVSKLQSIGNSNDLFGQSAR